MVKKEVGRTEKLRLAVATKVSETEEKRKKADNQGHELKAQIAAQVCTHPSVHSPHTPASCAPHSHPSHPLGDLFGAAEEGPDRCSGVTDPYGHTRTPFSLHTLLHVHPPHALPHTSSHPQEPEIDAEKKLREHERKSIEDLVRERDILNKNLTKAQSGVQVRA